MTKPDHKPNVSAAIEEPPLLTVVIPVYNEIWTIHELLHRVLSAPYSKQVIVVDDCSTDGTSEVLQDWNRHPEVELLRQPRNCGKGAAIRAALTQARGAITIIQDADLEYDPQDYPRLVEPLLSGTAEAVYGSRYLCKNQDSSGRWSMFRLGVSLLNCCVRLLYGTRLTDEATCYKAFPTAILRAMGLRCERFDFCPEVTAKASRMGLRITEVPIRYCPRDAGAGKKIRWTDGVRAIAALWRWRRWKPDAESPSTLATPGTSVGPSLTRDNSRQSCNQARPLPSVDVVIPVLNEVEVLEQSVVTLRAFLKEQVCYPTRIVVAENGSTDGTAEVARQLAETYEDVACVALKQRGRGRALRLAWTESRADIVVYMDVDLSTGLESIEPMCRAIHEEGYEIATGSRLMKGSRIVRCWKREMISRLYNLFVRCILLTRFSDAQCGFKAVSRRAVEELVPLVKDEAWFFDTELMVLAEKRGYPIKDVPVAWVEDPDSRVKIISTAWEDIKGVFRLRWTLWTHRFESKQDDLALEKDYERVTLPTVPDDRP